MPNGARGVPDRRSSGCNRARSWPFDHSGEEWGQGPACGHRASRVRAISACAPGLGEGRNSTRRPLTLPSVRPGSPKFSPSEWGEGFDGTAARLGRDALRRGTSRSYIKRRPSPGLSHRNGRGKYSRRERGTRDDGTSYSASNWSNLKIIQGLDLRRRTDGTGHSRGLGEFKLSRPLRRGL